VEEPDGTTDLNLIAVPQGMSLDTSGVDEGAVLAAEIDQNPLPITVDDFGVRP
jgi:hypothetical protein